MASKQEYLNMMKRMDRMGEERIPASMNMGIDSMMNKVKMKIHIISMMKIIKN